MLQSISSSIGSPLVAGFLLILVALFFGFVLSSGTATNSLGITLGLIMFILAIVRTDLALYFLILSMLLSPEIGFGGLQEEGVSGGRSVVIRLDDLFLILIAFGWLARSAIFKEVGLVLRSPINGPIYAYTASFVIATGAGILYGDVEPPLLGIFNCLKFMEYFILFFMVLNHIESEKDARRLLRAAFLTAFIIAIYGLAQIPSGARVSAPFEGEDSEPNTLGGYMLFIMSITLAVFLESKSFYRQAFFAGMSLFCLVVIFYTESRSSYLGLLCSFLVLAFYAKRRNILLLGFVVIIIFSTVLLPDRVVERVSYTFVSETQQNPFQQGNELDNVDSSTKARLRSWGEAYKGWKKYPILGWGVTGHRFIDAQYMKIMVETGAIGCIAFLILLSRIYANINRIYRATRGKDEYYQGIALGTLAGFVGLCGHAVGTNTFIIIRIMEPFWLFTGVVMSIPQFLPEVGKELKGEPDEAKEVLEEEKEIIRFFS